MANGENDEEKDKVLLWLPCHGCVLGRVGALIGNLPTTDNQSNSLHVGVSVNLGVRNFLGC